MPVRPSGLDKGAVSRYVAHLVALEFIVKGVTHKTGERNCSR
ncbi:MAG: hypothetical protein R2709_14705 [Marmoricola sp.]